VRYGLRERAAPILAFGGSAAALPALLLHFFGRDSAAAIGGGWHFFGVGMSALAAAFAALLLTTAGARRNDGRTVLVGTAFAAMAALLALHGLATPGFIVDMNGVIAFTGAATLPVGGAILALSALPALRRPRRLKPLIALEVALMLGILALGTIGLVWPNVVPAVPEAGSPPALAALAAGSVFYLLVGLRALGTFALTRRANDLVLAIGVAWLAAALPAALLLTYEDLGWWLGHGFELVGLVLVGVPVAVDLFRTAQSRPLAGDLHAAELVAAEEAFLGAHVRALTIRLAQKDEYTEEHTRRVALRAVQVGERLGLPPGRLRALAIGGLIHDIGKLSVPDSVLKKPTSLSDEEFAVIRRHPEWGDRLVTDLGGFTAAVRRLVRDHHERLDGSGYPRGLCSKELELDTRILAVCDVYDALISARVYRDAWSHEDALALLRTEADVTLDTTCVDALEQVLAEERTEEREAVARPATSARRARTRPATPAAETS
jgi:HD-GYP domain-containing protein (c-di-GMP phosphodiesterase class II)